MDPRRVQEYIDIAMGLLYAVPVGYAAEYGSRRIVRTRMDILLFICGEKRHAKTDACVIDKDKNSKIILLVEEHKRYKPGPGHLIPQLIGVIAEAVAAFQQNNYTRQKYGLPILDSKIMPGITMIGTFPTFFKIHVSAELETGILLGQFRQYPTTPTIVLFYNSWCCGILSRRNCYF